MDHSICPNCGVKVEKDNAADKEREQMEKGAVPKYALCKKCWELQGFGRVLTSPKRTPLSEGEFNRDDNTPEGWEKMSRIRPVWYGKR